MFLRYDKGVDITLSMFEDWYMDTVFEEDYPYGLPSDTWTTKDGEEIKLTDMTTQHIKNCMKLVGEDDDWYDKFNEELERRKLEKPKRKVVIKRNKERNRKI